MKLINQAIRFRIDYQEYQRKNKLPVQIALIKNIANIDTVKSKGQRIVFKDGSRAVRIGNTFEIN